VTITSLKNDDTALGLPTKKLTVIKMEPILANNFYKTAGPCNINPLPKPRTNQNVWSLVTQMKFTYWGHSSIDMTGDYYDVLKLNKKAHTVLMTVLCDHGTQLGIMATNITDDKNLHATTC
jgi:hypothetical protein